ncbi:MAG TPA: hydrogenase maturation protease [Candidatus Sabulitectum sp.]|nr:hydrogenase maturation protease [Candidatus Sabulitectum sp.]HPF32664.1 hydrogenase maturation protease [Candidatus Sabulitectum sp.]HPJ29100.1 hydrogenase maturation protease [Candidatus Sabulitectum sp.]HPR22984.1 hydrogenase maturation protease [Candidatus Sabulitectum sp.]
MKGDGKRILVFGYGNPGRLDDGLGPAFAEGIEKLGLDGVTVDSNYQLSVEDSAEIAMHEAVVFADADLSCREPFRFRRVVPKAHMSFSSHSISAEALMALAGDLMSSRAEAFMLGIRGYEFNRFGEGLSPGARKNLEAALESVGKAIQDDDLSGLAERFGAESEELR